MTTKTTHKTKRPAAKRPGKWSAGVMQRSNALDLQAHIFQSRDSEKIARSLKRSAERSKRRKGTPFQSAMSMLNFYINRGGKNLSESKRKVLERAKNKLRELYGKPLK